MEVVSAFQAHALVWFAVICAVLCFGLALCWALNRKWRARRLAELREMYDRMEPSDPEYNRVRALYTSIAISSYTAELSAGGGSADGQASSDGATGAASSGGDGGGSGGD